MNLITNFTNEFHFQRISKTIFLNEQNVKHKLQERFEEKTEFLKSLELIQRCPSWCRNDIVTKLRSCMVLKTFAKEQIVMDSSKEIIDFLAILSYKSSIFYKTGLSTFNLYLIYHGEVGCFLDEKYLQKKLTQGQSFGELAYTFNRASKTSYKCLDQCQIYVVKKQDIPTILKDFQRSYQSRLTAKAFKQSPFFADWDLGSVSYLYYLGQLQNYVRNQTVYSQNNETDGIYLIVEGEFSYSIKKKTEKKQILMNTEGQIDSDQEKMELEKEVLELRTQAVQKTFVSKISTLSAGQIFGEEEVLKKINRKYNTTCESVEGLVIYFNQQVFWSLIYNNPQYKAILDDKVKKQDIVKQMQINYIKSSMDDYDNYLLGKQYAQGSQDLYKNDDDYQLSLGQIGLYSQKSSSKSGNNEEKSKKRQQQEKDDIKIAIEKIPLIDLKKINDQAKQFNQYSFDPQSEKFSNPNDQDQAENQTQNGNVTSRNTLKNQMRICSSINNQCQLEFIKMEGQTIYIPSGVSTSKANSNNNQQANHNSNNTYKNQNNLDSPFKLQKFHASSQEDLEIQIVSPRITQIENNNSPRYFEQTQKNKQNISTNNFMQMPISITNTQQNTPTNANSNSNQNQMNSGSHHKSSNSNELFELIMYHNSKKNSKSFNRMKKLIYEGEKMQEMNKKKYSLQNLFGADRSTPKSVISQIANILKEKQQNGEISNLQNAPLLISQFYSNLQQQSKEQNSQNNLLSNEQRSSSQDNMIEVSRQQTLNFLTSNQKQDSSNQQLSKQNSPQNAIATQTNQDKNKLFQPSTFAQAVTQHQQKPINIQQNKQKNNFLEDQINNFQMIKTPKNNNQIKDIQEKQNFNNSNLNELLNSFKNNQTEEDLSNQNELQQMNPERQIQINQNLGFLSSKKDQINNKSERLTLTERNQKSKTSNSAFRINKSHQQRQIITLQNKILQEQTSNYEILENQTLRPYHFDKNVSRKIRSSNGLKLEKDIFINAKQNNSQNDNLQHNDKKNSICSDNLMIEIDSNIKITPIEFYNQKKTSITSNFLDKPHQKDNNHQNHQKYNSLQNFPSSIPNSLSNIKETSKNNLYQIKDDNQKQDNNLQGGQEYTLPKSYLKNLRLNSDTSQLQRKQQSPFNKSDQNNNNQISNLKSNSQSSLLISPRLVLKQTRPLYHDSNSIENGKNKIQQSRNTFKMQEQLLQKHVQSTFQIQDNKQITSFIQKVIGREDKNKQYIPQQYVISYSSNLQSQNTKSFTDLPYLQQKQPISARHSHTQDKKFYFQKDHNKFRQSLHLDHLNKEFHIKNDEPQIIQTQEKSPSSRLNQVCEDLGYNFVKTKIQ